MQIIPAIDIIDGKCVRLEEGNYDKVTLYHREPVDMAKKFENAGLTRLHLVDLDGARAGSVKNWRVLERIAAKTSLVVDFGGGIKTGKDVEIAQCHRPGQRRHRPFHSSPLAVLAKLADRDHRQYRRQE